MTDLGEIKNVLGLSVQKASDKNEYSIHQNHYIQQLVSRTQLDKSYPYKIPIELGANLHPREEDDKAANPTAFRSIVGGLLYAATLTRPDVAFATNMVSRYMADPGLTHLKAAKRIVQYLKGRPNFSICYKNTSQNITIDIFSDADYAGDKGTRKSTSGYIVFVNKQPVSWPSFKQNCVLTSTVESEYVAACSAAKEGMWIRNLLEEILQTKCAPQINLFIDNEGAISLASTQMIKTLTKHIDVSFIDFRMS